MSSKSLSVRVLPGFPSVLKLDGVAFTTLYLQEVVEVSVAVIVAAAVLRFKQLFSSKKLVVVGYWELRELDRSTCSLFHH